MMELDLYFVSLAALVGLVTLVSEFVKNLFPAFFVDFKAQLLSWVLSLVAVFVGWYADIGFLADVDSILNVVLYGLGLGLVANGFFDITVVKTVLNFIFSMLKKKTSDGEG